MAQTTTSVNACDVALWIDNASGTLKDCSGSSNAVTMNFTKNIGDLRTFQQTWPVRLSCGKDGTFNLVAVYSTATDEAADILKNWYFAANEPALRTVKVYIPDKNVGSDVYAGEFVMESLDIPASSGEAGPIQLTAVLRPSGEFTLTTNAT